MWCICNHDWFGDCYSERFFWLKEFALLFCYMLFVMAMMMAMIRTKGMCDGIDDPDNMILKVVVWASLLDVGLDGREWDGKGRMKCLVWMTYMMDDGITRIGPLNRIFPPLCGRYPSEKLNSNSSINHGDGTRKQSCFLPLDFFLETLEKTWSTCSTGDFRETMIAQNKTHLQL